MKNLKQVLAENPELKTLINAVINHIGISSVNDVLNLGPAAGFSGFVYAHDTSKFYRHFRKTINTWLKLRAKNLNTDPATLILTFPGLTLYPEITEYNINQCLVSTAIAHDHLKPVEHAIAQVVLHEVCMLFKS